MKMILVFLNGELFRSIQYRTKIEAKGNYRIFIKHGYADQNGNKLPGTTFELI